MRTIRLASLPHWLWTTLVVVAASIFTASAVAGSTLWRWDYSGPGITASGTFTTDDTPDENGGFLITAITGMRNGSLITALQPAGTPIPGNEPFAVDDLVLLGPGPQLTHNGFGFAIADGTFANPFYADFLPTPMYLEFFSTPPFTPGAPGSGSSELPIQFSATPVPEPATFVLMLSAIGFGAFWGSLRGPAS